MVPDHNHNKLYHIFLFFICISKVFKLMSCQIIVAELDIEIADKECQGVVEADDRHVSELVPGSAVPDPGKFTFSPWNYMYPE